MKRPPSSQHKLSHRVRRSKRPLLWLAFSAAIALPTLAFVDTNDNGMSDIWEEQYNNGNLFPPGIDPQADADGDGWSNARESVAGTDPFFPNPPAGYLSPQLARIPAVYTTPEGGGDPVLESPEALALTWPTVPGKHYTLEFSPDLQMTSWLAVETGFIGNGNEVTYSFALEAQDKLFWRVAVTDVDSDNDGLNDAEEHTLGSNPANADSDGDGLTDAEEQTRGTDPTKSDTDSDLTSDSEDADPLDGAIPWTKTPECSYVVIELGKPPFDSSPEIPNVAEPRFTALGEGGHVLMSRDRESYWWDEHGWMAIGAPGPEYYETFVWSPGTNAWSGPLGMPANIRGCGSAIDIQGNVYGSGYGAINDNTPTALFMPGSKPVSLRWDKATPGWNQASTDVAVALSPGFTNDHATMLQTDGMIKCFPCLFGESGRIISQSAGGGNTSIQMAKLLRLGTVDITPICMASSDGNGNTVQITDLKVAGEPTDWHAATWTKTTLTGNPGISQTIPEYKFARLAAGGQVTDNTPPAGAARWNLHSLAGIDSNRLPTGIHDIVIWSMTDGSFQVGTSPTGSGALTWKESTQPDATKRIGGKINSRGEGLAATKLWRNGKWHPLDGFVDSAKWTNVHGLDINSTGTILATADKTGAGANAVDTPVLLLPFEVVSRDKFLAGSFEIPEGWDSLEMEFVGPGGENIGKYGQLLGGGTTKIYDSTRDILSEQDVSTGSQPSTQKVWFVKDPAKPRNIRFYTCYNSVGQTEIKLYFNGASIAVGGVAHELTYARDFADTIAYVDAWVKGTAFYLPDPNPPPLGLLSAPMALAQAQNVPGEEGIDNLTRACLIPFFNVINQVEGLAAVTSGLFDGVRSGIEDDWAFIKLIGQAGVAAGDWAFQQASAELQKWKDDPLKRASELKQLADKVCEDWVFEPLRELQEDLSTWEGFQRRSWQTWNRLKGGAEAAWTLTQNAWSKIVDGLTEWADDFYGRMIQGTEKTHWDNTPWVKDHLLSEVNRLNRVMSYTFGYTFGYLGEQVAVGALTAGSVKIAQVVAKGGVHLAANLAKRTVAVVAVRAHMLKRLLAEAVVLPEDLVAAYYRGFSLASTGPIGEGMDRVAMEVLQEGANAGKLVWREYVDNIVGKTSIRQFVKQGGQNIIERQFARLMHILGDDFTSGIGRNFLKVADEFILVKRANGTVDEFFEGFFKAMEGNPSLMKHADDFSIRTGGSLEELSPNAKTRLKQILSDPDPGNPWKLDDPVWIAGEDPPIPHNYWARGNLLELQQFKKVYKPLGFTHHPNIAGYDYSSAANDLFVQMKSLRNPDAAIARMKEAIDDLIEKTPPGTDLLLHIVKRPGSSSTALQQAIAEHLGTKATIVQTRFLPTIIEEFVYP